MLSYYKKLMRVVAQLRGAPRTVDYYFIWTNKPVD